MDLAMEQGIPLRNRLLTPKQCAYSRDELSHAEWLGDVVICPELEAYNTVRFIAACSENEYWSAGIFFVPPELAADFKPIHAGQHEIENQQVCGIASHFRQRQAAVGDGSDTKPLSFQVIAKQPRYIRLVFDN
jgi:hypothetical protein